MTYIHSDDKREIKSNSSISSGIYYQIEMLYYTVIVKQIHRLNK